MGSVEDQRRQQGYFVRLGSLSARIRHLAYEHSLGKLRQSKHRAQDTLAQLQETLELVRARDPPLLQDAGQSVWIERQLNTGSRASPKREAELGAAVSSCVYSALGDPGLEEPRGVMTLPGESGRGFVEEGKEELEFRASQGRSEENLPLLVPSSSESSHPQRVPPHSSHQRAPVSP